MNDREIEVTRRPAIEAGGCNGCHRGAVGSVAVMRLRGTELRVCRACTDALRTKLRAAWDR